VPRHDRSSIVLPQVHGAASPDFLREDAASNLSRYVPPRSYYRSPRLGHRLSRSRSYYLGPITAFGHITAIGPITVFGHITAFGPITALGPITAFGHITALGPITPSGMTVTPSCSRASPTYSRTLFRPWGTRCLSSASRPTGHAGPTATQAGSVLCLVSALAIGTPPLRSVPPPHRHRLSRSRSYYLGHVTVFGPITVTVPLPQARRRFG
jgi:hypothetical protein